MSDRSERIRSGIAAAFAGVAALMAASVFVEMVDVHERTGEDIRKKTGQPITSAEMTDALLRRPDELRKTLGEAIAGKGVVGINFEDQSLYSYVEEMAKADRRKEVEVHERMDTMIYKIAPASLGVFGGIFYWATRKKEKSAQDDLPQGPQGQAREPIHFLPDSMG